MSDNGQTKSKQAYVFIPEYWSKKLQKNLDDTGVMIQCVNRDYEGEVKQAGDTVHIQTAGSVAVADYDSTTALTYELITDSTQELLIDQEKKFSFKVKSVEKAQANIDLLAKYMERAKIAVDLVRDTFLLGKQADVAAGNIIGTLTTPIALTKDNVYGYFSDLYEKLETANALTDGTMPWVVINPKIKNLIKKSPEFISASNMGDVVKRKGTIGEIAGFQILVSTNFKLVSGKYHILAGTNEAITFASQVTEVEKLRDQDSFADLVRGLYVYGAKVTQPTCLAKIIATVE